MSITSPLAYTDGGSPINNSFISVMEGNQYGRVMTDWGDSLESDFLTVTLETPLLKDSCAVTYMGKSKWVISTISTGDATQNQSSAAHKCAHSGIKHSCVVL